MRWLFNDTYAIFLSQILYKSICWYLFELPRLVEAIQMSTISICLYKEADKSTSCNLKTTKLLDCALITVCGVIMSNTVVLQNKSTVFSRSIRQTGHRKQRRRRSDGIERNVWSWSILFTTHPAILYTLTGSKWTCLKFRTSTMRRSADQVFNVCK